MEAGTISRIRNTCSLRLGRRLPPTLEVEELQFLVVNTYNVKKEIDTPQWGGKLLFKEPISKYFYAQAANVCTYFMPP
jgi:hypothetical protein